MSVTGPGCAHCDRGRVTGPDGDVRPCDRCGGLSQFDRPLFADDAPTPSSETDWRPLPSCAEVLAHNDRMSGTVAPWLCLAIPDDPLSDLSVAWLRVSPNGQRVERVGLGWVEPAAATIGAYYRPITRRGEALPWPGVQR